MYKSCVFKPLYYSTLEEKSFRMVFWSVWRITVEESQCFTFNLAHVTQRFLDAKLSLATVAAAEAGHFLFPLCVGRVIPGELSAGLQHPDGEKTHQVSTNYKQSQPASRDLLPPLSHLLVKKAMTGKAGSWESVKTFWMNRFGWQLCCRVKGQSLISNLHFIISVQFSSETSIKSSLEDASLTRCLDVVVLC